MVRYRVEFKTSTYDIYQTFGRSFHTLEEAIEKFKELDRTLTDSPHHYNDYLARIVKVTTI